MTNHIGSSGFFLCEKCNFEIELKEAQLIYSELVQFICMDCFTIALAEPFPVKKFMSDMSELQKQGRSSEEIEDRSGEIIAKFEKQTSISNHICKKCNSKNVQEVKYGNEIDCPRCNSKMTFNKVGKESSTNLSDDLSYKASKRRRGKKSSVCPECGGRNVSFNSYENTCKSCGNVFL